MFDSLSIPPLADLQHALITVCAVAFVAMIAVMIWAFVSVRNLKRRFQAAFPEACVSEMGVDEMLRVQQLIDAKNLDSPTFEDIRDYPEGWGQCHHCKLTYLSKWGECPTCSDESPSPMMLAPTGG